VNLMVQAIPASLLRRMLRVLHLRPGLAARVGYKVYPDVFYNPFPTTGEVDLERLKQKRSLPAIEFDLPGCKALFADLAAASATEANDFLRGRPERLVARWDLTYPPNDAAVLYAMLRRHKPRRYIEVGCGYSTHTSTAALARNAAEGHPCRALFVEPYPPDHLDVSKLPGEFIRDKVQRVPLERFTELDAGEILFIDTSHVIKTQNDVEYELLQILPSLKPGVIVHIHDIFSPYDYPEEWLVGEHPNRGGNNEQYALECLLSGGADWEVLLPTYLLWKDDPELYRRLVDSARWPAAFWIRKKAASKSGLYGA